MAMAGTKPKRNFLGESKNWGQWFRNNLAPKVREDQKKVFTEEGLILSKKARLRGDKTWFYSQLAVLGHFVPNPLWRKENFWWGKVTYLGTKCIKFC